MTAEERLRAEETTLKGSCGHRLGRRPVSRQVTPSFFADQVSEVQPTAENGNLSSAPHFLSAHLIASWWWSLWLCSRRGRNPKNSPTCPFPSRLLAVRLPEG